MKKTGIAVTILLLLGMLFLPCKAVLAAADGFYQLSEITAPWDGTDADRLKAKTADYTYGDEANLVYRLPWPFTFYGQSYNGINVDTNGNVWFVILDTGGNITSGPSGSAHSFNLGDTKTSLTATSRGPVIAAWNNDLSSYYYGGVFVQHKTDSGSDRVIIEWRTETYTDEGNYRVSNFETVLFANNTIRIDYKPFNSSTQNDFGSGISRNDGMNFVSIPSEFGKVPEMTIPVSGIKSFTFINSGIPYVVRINPPTESTNNPASTLALQCREGATCTQMRFSNDNVTWTTAESFAATKSWPLPVGEGLKTVYSQVSDNGGTWYSSTDSILFDTTPPVSAASVAEGIYNAPVTVALTCSDGMGSGCDRVYYTKDGSIPTTASQVFAAPISIATNTILKFFSTDKAGNAEPVKTRTYTIDTALPVTTALPAAGTYYAPQSVTLTCSDGAGTGCDKIYYSTNGSTPTTASAIYSGPVAIPVTATLKCFATDIAGNAESVKTVAYIIDPKPDLIVTAVTPPATVGSALAITVPVMVKNQGAAGTGGFYVYLYLSTDSTITASDTYLGYQYVSSLAAGAQQTVNFSVTMPSVTGGTYHLGTVADPPNYNHVLESDETNNSLATQVTVANPDLIVTAVTPPATVGSALTITVPVTVKNQGASGTGLFYVYLYLSTDSTITASDTYLGYQYVNSLAAGAQQTVNFTVTMPSVTGGTYYLGSVADPPNYNHILETNEANNTLATQVTVTNIDLLVTNVTPPASVIPAQTISVPVTVKNQGTAPVSNFEVALYISTDSTITSSDVEIGRVPISNLAAGASLPVNISGTIPSPLASGTYYIGAIVDPANGIAEYNETNNALSGTATIVLPTLTVSTTATAGAGGTVTSSPAGISCGSACSSTFTTGTSITLTVSAATNSVFAGWSGACSGTGTCQVAMNSNKAVTATFNTIAPVAAFSASPTAGGTPLIANFTDQSQHVTTWLWNFGDNTTSTAQNTSHVYKTPGTYTITLTVSNESGSSTAQKTITVTACQNQPVRILETNTYYPSLTAALAAVVDGQTIQLQEWNFAEGATILKSITLDGGYDCTFTNKTGRSVLEGELHLSGGSVKMKDVRIAGAALSALPVITVAPNADSYGSVLVNSASVPHTFTIGNSGGANLTIGTITLSGSNSGEFVKSADACTGKALTPGTNCAVQAAFAPVATGPRTTTLTIPSNDPVTSTASITLNGIGTYPAITISKTGTGTGTVSSSPGGISCGSVCNGSFAPVTITLSASPDAISSFAGWSGGGCSGTGVCTPTLTTDTQVTATFNLQPVTADFTAIPQTGSDPLLVSFNNNSHNATSWFWDFGDGTTGSELNPTHVYRTPGTFNAILTVGNSGGTAVLQKTITVSACQTLPVRIKETAAYYPSLADALSAVTVNQTLQLQDRTFAGDFTIGNTITLDGGYDCGYSTVKTGKTVLKGVYHINGGAVTMKDIHVAK